MPLRLAARRKPPSSSWNRGPEHPTLDLGPIRPGGRDGIAPDAEVAEGADDAEGTGSDEPHLDSRRH